MAANPLAVRLKSYACLILSMACLCACQKKTEPIPPVPATIENPAAEPLSEIPESDAVDAEVIPPPALPKAATASPGLQFTTRPPAKAYPGKVFTYRPAFSQPGSFRLRVAKGPDSTMKVEKGRVSWMPSKVGRYPVILEATLAASGANDRAKRIQQEFVIAVEKVLSFAMKPLQAKADKGDTVTFDFRASSHPAWAASMVTIRIDYEGDGKWDTEALPLTANLLHRHVFGAVGRFAPKAEARYLDLEILTVEGSISIVSSVMPVLRISQDTLEPGAAVAIDASESKADGRLVFSLDLDGDGKVDWTDSVSGKAMLKAPGSGIYTAVLTAKNPMGQEGKATAVLRVNARPKLELKVRNPKENMAAMVELKARASDADDSLSQVRVNYTGNPKDWNLRTSAPDKIVSSREWLLRFKHAYGKPGKYTASVCVTSHDGREACHSQLVEVFNA
ncbi:MAG: hypothetical protein M3Y08_01950, partial [Fibrobacterota bacterium]|nr:hypothetical protein [Fibrobacterota bacterium]